MSSPPSPALGDAVADPADATAPPKPFALRDRVEAWEDLLECVRLVGDLEFEERLVLRDLDGPLTVVDARDLDDDAVVPGLLDDRLGDAQPLDACADDLQRAVDRLCLVRDRALRVVDLEREVHTALQVETLPQRHSIDGRVEERAVGAALADTHVARKERPDRAEHEDADKRQAPLQVGHATTGWREVRAWNH